MTDRGGPNVTRLGARVLGLNRGALEFVDDEALVAFGGQGRGHPPGRRPEARLVQDPAERIAQVRGARLPADPQAGPGAHHPGGVVGLVAAERRHDQRHPGGQRLDHGAVPAVGEHGRAVRQHVGVADPAADVHVGWSADRRRVHRRAGGHQPADREPAERVGRPLQQLLLVAHHGAAQADQDERAAVRIVPRPVVGVASPAGPAGCVVELRADVADVARHVTGGEVETGAGADQDPVDRVERVAQVAEGRQAVLGPGLVEGGHPGPEHPHQQRRGGPVAAAAQAPARGHEPRPRCRGPGPRHQVRARASARPKGTRPLPPRTARTGSACRRPPGRPAPGPAPP